MAYTALTDLDTVHGILNPTVDESTSTPSDTVLTALIGSVSAAIANYCNRNFLAASYTETYNGSGTETLFLRQRPIQSVASLTVNQQSIPSRPVPGAWGYSFDQNVLYLAGGFQQGQQNVSVTYTAGLPEVSATATPDLWQAAAEWVVNAYKNFAHLEKGSDSAGQGMSTVYLKDMPWTVRLVVDLYRHVATEGQVLGI